jgi:hypothetical protein
MANTRRFVMGIHYDYKSTRSAKKMQKQQEREQRRLQKRQQSAETTTEMQEDKPLNLDMITDPDK